MTHAAQSRKEPYRTRDTEQSTRYLNGPQRLSAEDLEKARKPAVKRLANVTQLCMFCILPASQQHMTNEPRRFPRLLLRPPHLRTHPPDPPLAVQGPEPSSARDARRRLQHCSHTIPRPRACQPAQAAHAAKTGRLPDPHPGWSGWLWTGVLGPEKGHARSLRLEGHEQEAVVQAG